MRVWAISLAMAALAATTYRSVQGQGLDAAQVLSAARDAIGGEKRLSGVRSFSATGRTRQLRGNNLVPIVFEINCELPDKFVRTDEFPAQDADPTTQGFNGNDLIQWPPPPPGRGAPPVPSGGRAGAPAPSGGRSGPPPLTATQQRLATVKQDFVRLTLGMFATPFSTYPLTFTYAAMGEAPEGKADILDVAGPANFSAQFVVQRDTHLPVMLMWRVPASNAIVHTPGQPAPNPPPGSVVVEAPAPPAATATQDERDQYASTIATLRRQGLAQAKPVDYRVYYGDFRTVDGLKLPFRLRRAIAGETIEETTFDRIRINPTIDPRKFEVQK